MNNKRKFAVFDIDGTLIRWQMFHAIVHELGKQGYILRETHDKIKDARMQWKTRGDAYGFHEYEQVLLHAYLETLPLVSPNGYHMIVDHVFNQYCDQTYIYTRDLIRSLKEQGYLLFAISGSQDDIIQRLAKHHGFDDAVGATLEIEDNKFTGKINTPVLDKQNALSDLIIKHNAIIKDSYGVGDSLSDAALLESVHNPIAFNPDRTLFSTAKERGWQIVIERKNMVFELKHQDGSYILA